MNAQKYSHAKEISPQNKVIQTVPFAHAQINKLWYVESLECLPEHCTQLRAQPTLQPTPGSTQKWERRSQQGCELCRSAHGLRNTWGPQQDKRTVRVPAARLLVTTPPFIPISFKRRGDKCAVQTAGRERDFSFLWINIYPRSPPIHQWVVPPHPWFQ